MRPWRERCYAAAAPSKPQVERNDSCSQYKPHKGVPPLRPIVPKSRNERVVYDYAQLPGKDPHGHEWMAWAITCSNANSSTVASFIKKTFVHGQFHLWQSNNGKHFKNTKVRTLIEETMGGKVIYSSPYHPQTNAHVERPNGTQNKPRSILDMNQTNGGSLGHVQ